MRQRRGSLVFAWCLWIALLVGLAPPAAAQASPAAPTPASENADALRAREEFRAGSRLVEQSEWAAALAAFERSVALRPHALTVYNIGVCQRFLGRYTLAARTLRSALARSEGSAELPALFRDQATAYVDEIDRKLARISVSVSQPEATILVDGRPLDATPSGDFVAGIAQPGEGKRVPAARFVIVADPGGHVITFQLEGHDTVEVRPDLKPGTTEELSMSLTEQNAELQIDADRSRCVVRVDDVDVGLTPVSVTRPPGRHSISVLKAGYVTYGSSVTLRPGQHTRLAAELPVERIPLTKRWWFWTAAAAVVATGALVTYALTRPTPDPPPYDGGTTGWVATPRSLHW
jgi:hypothetical protein